MLLGLSSVPYNKLSTEKKSLEAKNKTSLMAATEAKKKTNDLKIELEKYNLPPKEAENVSLLVQKLNYGIRDLATKYSLKTGGVRIKGSMGASNIDATTLGTAFAQVKTLKVVTLNIDGEYTDIDKLHQFIDELYSYGLSIGGLTIRQNRFTLSVDAYGN